MNFFAKRIKSLRNDKKLLQKDIANILGITERQYRDYEAGKVDPPTSKTVKLADCFDVSIDYLVGRSDDSKRR